MFSEETLQTMGLSESLCRSTMALRQLLTYIRITERATMDIILYTSLQQRPYLARLHAETRPSIHLTKGTSSGMNGPISRSSIELR